MIEVFKTHYSPLITIIYGLAALALIYAAFTDLRHRIIKNEVSIFIITLFIFTAILNIINGHTFSSSVFIPFGTAFFVFLLTSGLFALRMMGGGDVKLMSSFALIAGLQYTIPFLLYTTVFGGIVALATLAFYRFQTSESQMQKFATVDMSSDLYLASVAHPANTDTQQTILNKKPELSTPASPATTNESQSPSIKVPYGIAISAVGLWVLFQLFTQINGG
jgi:prepilin peptidase CpaA